MDQNEKIKPSGKALIPFAVFIFLYLGVGIILETSGTEMAFYQLKEVKMDQNEKIKPSGKALIPFAVFIFLYLGVGIILETSGTEMAFYQLPAPVAIIVGVVLYLGVGIILETSGTEMAFYQLPAPVAIIVGVVVAFIIFKGSIEEKFSPFAKGCGNENILIMCFIYLLEA